MKIAVIPARGGSKRIPRKNIKFFCGKPMIAWSIEAAHACGLFDHIIVSTDDAEIAEVAKHYGAEVPFVRPAELSDDHTGTLPTIAHAVEWFRQQGDMPDPVCCLYATAPFVMASDLQRGLKTLTDTHSDFAFSVTSYAFPIQRAIRLTPENRVEMFQPESFSVRSQDLPEALHDAGQFYWGRANAWLSGKVIFGPDSAVVRLPRHRVQDIDTLEDWTRAEYLFRAMTQAKPSFSNDPNTPMSGVQA
jgi:N-acylneuraminate cytidylyltransferase